MALPQWATRVTSFSKAVAMFLFIFLPFVGFYLGMQYQASIAQPQESIIVQSTPTPIPTVVQSQASCQTDSDCILTRQDLNSASICCGAFNCGVTDYSGSEWVAMNKSVFEANKQQLCGQKRVLCPMIKCAVQDPSSANYVAKCVNSVCEKVKKAN